MNIGNTEITSRVFCIDLDADEIFDIPNPHGLSTFRVRTIWGRVGHFFTFEGEVVSLGTETFGENHPINVNYDSVDKVPRMPFRIAEVVERELLGYELMRV